MNNSRSSVKSVFSIRSSGCIEFRAKKSELSMFSDVVLVMVFIFINLFEKTQSASIDLLRYHANLYRCGEMIIDEDLIRPLYSYFVSIQPAEHRNTKELMPIMHSLARIERACRTAYLTSNEEMKKSFNSL